MMNANKWQGRWEGGKNISIVIVGTGELGAPLVAEVAQLPGVEGIALVDHACCGEGDPIRGEAMRRDVGKPKVDVQARRARRINPHLEIETIHAPVETVPLGRLRGRVILAAVDSAAARRRVNQAAWRLGIPWIDGRVGRRGDQVRVRSYVPGPDAPCLECGGEAADDGMPGQSTDAAAEGGPIEAAPGGRAVAAGLMIAECMRLLEGNGEQPVRGRQVLIDLRRHVLHATSLERDVRCPFDHAVWNIEPVAQSPTKLTAAQAIRAAAGERGLCPGWAIRLEGLTFVHRQYCGNCRTVTRDSIHLAQRIPSPSKRCPTCGRPMQVRPPDTFEALELSALKKPERRRTLHSMGLREGDVYSVEGPRGTRHFELSRRPRPAANGRREAQPATPT